MKPFIMPFAGVGSIILGEASEAWLDVRKGDNLVTVTRLPRGRCIIPLSTGTVGIYDADQQLARATIDPDLMPSFGPGPYEVHGAGTINVWRFDGDRSHGLLAGGPPMASGDHVLDLSTLKLPHGSLRLAVQVRRGDHLGPVVFVLYQPKPRPAVVSLDHDVGGLGPRAHLVVDPGGLQQLELTVERQVRQTDETVSQAYEVTPDANRITFDDLLHGDRLVVRVEPPHALLEEGPVADLTYQYHAVPEPRLQRVGQGSPVAFEAGVAALPGSESGEAVRTALGGLLGPTWLEEFPNVTRGQIIKTLPEALEHAGVSEENRRGPGLRWWLGVVESKQSVTEARRVRNLRLVCPASRVGQVAEAAGFLEQFPAHVFRELGAEDDLTREVLAFQENLGIQEQRGDAAVRLAGQINQALETASNHWADNIRAAGLQWLDGAVPPLDGGLSLDGLRKLIVQQPAQAMQQLRASRQKIWQVARVPGTIKVKAPDLQARQAILEWHIERTSQALTGLTHLLEAAGVEASTGTTVDASTIARHLSDMLRASEAATARVVAVPTHGPAFVEGAAEEGRSDWRALDEVLDVWAGANVPAAIRLPAQRLRSAIDEESMARMAVWHHFLQDAEGLVRDVGVLSATPNNIGQLAGHVEKLLAEALELRNPSIFAEACSDFARIENGLMAARAAWRDAIHGCARETCEAIGLESGAITPWDAIRRRIVEDAQELRVLAELMLTVGHDSMLEKELREGGGLDTAIELVERAGPEVERALAVSHYDRLRIRIGERFGDRDALAALRGAYVDQVLRRIEKRLQQRIGDLDDAKLAAFASFDSIDGARELGALLRYVHVTLDIDVTTPQAVADAQEANELLTYVESLSSDPWQRIADAIAVRMRAAYLDLSRYMQERTPLWDTFERTDTTLQWIHSVCTGVRDPNTGTDVASMLPGTRRLVEHTLKERGLWLA